MTNIWNNFTEYIINNYESSTKIVEVGVGRILKPSMILKDKMNNTKIYCVDINPSNNIVIKDDITNPNYNIYENASLIYSIRPPEELQKYILNVSEKVGSDCIIKPFFTEELNPNIRSKFKLINYKKEVFYELKK